MDEDSHRLWVDSMPEAYDRYLGPVLFAPFADDLARRIARFAPARILELAAGTGVLTRELIRIMPGVDVVATDLNPAMVRYGQARVPAATWQDADAAHLPVPDGSVDVVCCQFGAMFFPDRPAAFAEAGRVLVPGGRLVFSTWDVLANHHFDAAVTECLRELFPADPPSFLATVPHGYTDPARIAADVSSAGLRCESIGAVTRHGTAEAADVALGFCTGTPVRAEIEARAELEPTTALMTASMRERLGDGPITGAMTAHVVVAQRPA
jgi:SAM-dependent methyltransferase